MRKLYIDTAFLVKEYTYTEICWGEKNCEKYAKSETVFFPNWIIGSNLELIENIMKMAARKQY